VVWRLHLEALLWQAAALAPRAVSVGDLEPGLTPWNSALSRSARPRSAPPRPKPEDGRTSQPPWSRHAQRSEPKPGCPAVC